LHHGTPIPRPYQEFNRAVGTATREAYEKGPLARLGGEPDHVAKAVERAINARKAPLRMRVTASATMMVGQRKLMSDRMWDRFLTTQFPVPATDQHVQAGSTPT